MFLSHLVTHNGNMQLGSDFDRNLVVNRGNVQGDV